MRALRSRRTRARTAPQSSWHSGTGNDEACDTPLGGGGLRIHVTTVVALDAEQVLRVGSTSAVQSSDLLFARGQQSRRGGYPAQMLPSYRFDRRLPMANVVCICRLQSF